MNARKTITVFIVPILFFLNNCSNGQPDSTHISEYIGQEQRVIKSLSESDIEELKTGQGWGLAKAAELNGIPGPRHVLDMGSQIELTLSQVEKIQHFSEVMQKDAIKWGQDLIEAEKSLNQFFIDNKTNFDSLKSRIMEASHALFELRFVHLKSHLQTAEVLSEQQINMYNTLRGYNSDTDPCEEVPEGHDPKLWRKHNNCE